MSNVVHVEGISSKTSKEEIQSFFSFCGKISNLDTQESPADGTKTATVTFEKAAAAKTALLLDNTQLGPNSVHVHSPKTMDELADEKGSSSEEAHKEHIEQEDKPRGRIIAEYLAHGYVISDKAIEKALDLDKQHGISNRFVSTLNNFDSKFQATQKAQTVDSKLGLTEKANWGWQSLNSYFNKAAGTPTGQKLRQFYETGNKTVMDVHNEARYLADLKGGKQAGAASSSTEKPTLEQVPGTDKTTCNCGSSSANCPCEPGKCACNNCEKSSTATSAAPATTL